MANSEHIQNSRHRVGAKRESARTETIDSRRRIKLPDEFGIRIGQRVFFSVHGMSLRISKHPTKLFHGRISSARIKKIFWPLRRQLISH